MLTFWANVREADIEHYARSLVLPAFMSHLRMDPFSFSQQQHNADGREPLVVLYSGDGRLEEILLKPEKHALAILGSLDTQIDTQKVSLPDGPIWTWSGGSEETPELRLYFVPLAPGLNRESSDVFPPAQAYLSVSRKELFISESVIRLYFEQCCKAIVSGSNKADSLPEWTQSSSGLRFRCGQIGGEWIVSMDAVMDDLLCFARLKRAAQYLEPTQPIDWSDGDIELRDDGVHIYIKNM